MKVIADLGGTKSDWRIIEKESISQHAGGGFNASSDTLQKLALALPEGLDWKQVDQLHVYIAGFSDAHTQGIKTFFADLGVQTVDIYPDTLGVARSLYGDQPGWVGILGTGSAAIYYDGHKIASRIPSLGYILGDAGSGVDLGKSLVRAFLRNQFNDTTMNTVREEFPAIIEAEMIHEVYSLHAGRHYFGRFVPFINKHLSSPQIYQLVEESFKEYFESYFISKSMTSISFSGSVAFYFADVLHRVVKEKGIKINRIVQSPIAGLTLFHQQHE